MTNDELKRSWRVFLAEIGKSETEIAKEIDQKQSNLNRKIRDGSIRYVELSEIVEKYGYSVRIHKG